MGDIAPYVIAVVGVVLVGMAAYVWVEDRERERYEALRVHGYNVDAEQRIEQVCLALSGAEQTLCIRDTIQATNEHQRAERNLSAQNRMALWAGLMFWGSVLSTLVAGVGIYFIWRSLSLNSEAVGEARKANEIADEMASWERRPWISMAVERTNDPATFQADERRITTPIAITLTNHGRSPAEYWVQAASVRLSDRSAVPFELKAMKDSFSEHPFKGIIFPSETPTPFIPHVLNNSEKYLLVALEDSLEFKNRALATGSIACMVTYRSFDSKEIHVTIRHFVWVIRAERDFFIYNNSQAPFHLSTVIEQSAT